MTSRFTWKFVDTTVELLKRQRTLARFALLQHPFTANASTVLRNVRSPCFGLDAPHS
jgi:hypothetical protein